MSQKVLKPQKGKDFLSFALRLTVGRRNDLKKNAIADELFHDSQNTKPLIGVVYFLGLTRSIADEDTDWASAEVLESALVAQREQNNLKSPGPLLRVVVANGGERMSEAVRVVSDMLVPLFRDDPTMLGVIGPDRSVAAT
ncbi:hypothetical protein GCM10009555_090250 [Acrocarpospora macrocephala]|uniref:Uncharacterized protein n=1 Tax=Acrocarpospora macrocephala TaxID=150177 RepID=A0A5M3WP48_9ACTN|nr:hypothetical protein [Acrocarpospora macrocephala]GES09001.1 hypothetical protein Amac_025970 [Acrocarpospora macrocephala]